MVLEEGLSICGVGVGDSGVRASEGLDGLRRLWLHRFFAPMLMTSEGEVEAE